MADRGDVRFTGRTKFCNECGKVMRKLDDSWQCSNCDRSDSGDQTASRKSGCFTAEINRINDDGHGIIETDYQRINVGPVRESIVGNEVAAILVRGKALILDEEARGNGYIEWLRSVIDLEPQSDDLNSGVKFCNRCSAVLQKRNGSWICPLCNDFQLRQTPKPGEVFTAEVDRVSNSRNGIIECEHGHINLGSLSRSAVGTEVTAVMLHGSYAFVLNKQPKQAVNELLEQDAQSGTDSAADRNEEEVPRDSSEGVEVTSTDKEVNRHTLEQDARETVGEKIETTSGLGGSTPDSDDDEELEISELRRKAQESAVEEIPADATSAPSASVEYNRSVEVKQYVKARAAGVCEGCGSPAPFTSKTGEPYLHAHHINELSDGGTDTVDTVIALCPNCHYRVHDGTDGEQYNERLHRILHEIERRY